MWAAPDGAATAAAPGAEMTAKGHNMLSWTSSGITYWAVSDLNQTELAQLRSMI
jgi:anti-sigma factor RsiW